MPRAFTDKEIKKIRALLLKSGRAAFLKRGLKGTTIDHLVDSAGIGKGSFYQFFQNKEELFLELFSAEIPAMMTRLHEVSFGSTENTREALIQLMNAMIHELETNKLVQVVINDPEQLERFLSSEQFDILQKRIAVANTPIMDCIKQAQAKGEIIDKDPREIAEMLGIVKYLTVHKDSLSPPMYRKLCASYPEVIANGLTCSDKGAK